MGRMYSHSRGEMTPIQKRRKNENDRVSYLESVPIHLKIFDKTSAGT